MIRVVHILGELRPSGMEKMLLTAAPLWEQHGVRCELVATGVAEGSFAGPLREAGYPVLHVPLDRRRPLAHLRAMGALFRRGRYDAAHIHTEQAFLYYALLARLAGTRTRILTKHAVYAYTGMLRRVRAWQRRLVRLSGGRYVFISPTVQRAEWKDYGNRGVVVPNWFDPAAFHPAGPDERVRLRRELGLPEDRILLTTVGNCNPVKNHRLLFDALARLAPEQPRLLHLHIGEEGLERERERVAELGLRERVRFLGPRLDVGPLVRAADIHVQCSVREGFSVAGVEALAAGLKTVFTRSPGLVDFRERFPSIVYADSTPESLAEGIREALREAPEAREARARVQFETAREAFGPEAGVAAYARLYHEFR